MIGAVAVRSERTSEIGSGEQRDVVLNAHFSERRIEGTEILAELVEQFLLCAELSVMRVISAMRYEEDLPRVAQVRASLDGSGNLLELATEIAVARERGELSGQVARGRERRVHETHFVRGILLYRCKLAHQDVLVRRSLIQQLQDRVSARAVSI